MLHEYCVWMTDASYFVVLFIGVTEKKDLKCNL